MRDRESRDDMARESYEEFARKMDQFENGPTTTNFEQLQAAGVELPAPSSIRDEDIRTKLWEVISQLARLRVYLDETDHLTDRELYTVLWSNLLREEVAAVDEVGFNCLVNLPSCDDEEKVALYLRHYADDAWRQDWQRQFPDQILPPHEDPPHDRDRLLPRPDYERGPEALQWLTANPSPSALASNRFPTTDDALTFVEQLYASGATDVIVDDIMMLPHDDWIPYADALIVGLPDAREKRRELFELMEHVGEPDEGRDELLVDCGQSNIRLWWD